MDDAKLLESLANFQSDTQFADNQAVIQQSALAYFGGGLAEIAIG